MGTHFWDNRSSDNSKKILKSLKMKNVGISYPKNTLHYTKARNLALKKQKVNLLVLLMPMICGKKIK